MSCRDEEKGEDQREIFSKDWNVAFGWFRTYNERMKAWLECIEEGRPETQGKTIPVIYATPERAFSDFIRPRVEGQVDLPIISFSMTGVNFDMNRFKPTFNDFHKIRVGDQWQLQPKSMPWNINYNVTVWAKFHTTLDIVAYSLLSRFTPKSYLMVGGRLSQIDFEGQNDSSDLEPGANTDRTLRHDYQFKVQGWMPMPFRTVGQVENIVAVFGEGESELDIDTILDPSGVTTIEDGFYSLAGSTESRIPGVYTSEIDESDTEIPNNTPQVNVFEEN